MHGRADIFFENVNMRVSCFSSVTLMLNLNHPVVLDRAGFEVWKLVEKFGQRRRPSDYLAPQPPDCVNGHSVDITQVLDVALGIGRTSTR